MMLSEGLATPGAVRSGDQAASSALTSTASRRPSLPNACSIPVAREQRRDHGFIGDLPALLHSTIEVRDGGDPVVDCRPRDLDHSASVTLVAPAM